jgi:hypothetical protein
MPTFPATLFSNDYLAALVFRKGIHSSAPADYLPLALRSDLRGVCHRDACNSREGVSTAPTSHAKADWSGEGG